MDFKYKIAEVAKDFGVPAKKVIETVAPLTGEAYKTGGTFGEKELDLLLETLTRANAEALMTRNGIEWLNSTTKSIEEIAATIVAKFHLQGVSKSL